MSQTIIFYLLSTDLKCIQQKELNHLILKQFDETWQSTIPVSQDCPAPSSFVSDSLRRNIRPLQHLSELYIRYIQWVVCKGAAGLDRLVENEFVQIVSGLSSTEEGNTPWEERAAHYEEL